jgi:hypothetical protein
MSHCFVYIEVFSPYKTHIGKLTDIARELKTTHRKIVLYIGRATTLTSISPLYEDTPYKMKYSSKEYSCSNANHEESPVVGYTLMLSSKALTSVWKGVSIHHFDSRQDAYASVTVLCERIRLLHPQCVFTENTLSGDHTWRWAKYVWKAKAKESDGDKGDEKVCEEKKCRGLACKEKQCKDRTCTERLCKEKVCQDRTCNDKTCKAIHDERQFWGWLWLERNHRFTYSTSSSLFDCVITDTLKQMVDNGDIAEAARAAKKRLNRLVLSMEKMKSDRQGTWEFLGPHQIDSEEGFQELLNHIMDSKVAGLRECEEERSDANDGYNPNGADDEERSDASDGYDLNDADNEDKDESG